MNELILGHDPGVARSATILVDRQMNILALSAWEGYSGSSHPYVNIAKCAADMEQVVDDILGPHNNDKITLVHEETYIANWTSKTKLPGLGFKQANPLPAFDLCKSIGVWIGRFPYNVKGVHSATWRANVKINQREGRDECKRKSVELMKEHLMSDVLVVGDETFEIKDHISDAFWIAKAYVDGKCK